MCLAGESGLLDLEGRRDEDTTIGWHLVAGFEADDVTWHELLGRHLDELVASAATPGRHDQHLPECGNALGGLPSWTSPSLRDHAFADDHQACRDLLQRDDADDGGSEEHELPRSRY